MKRLLLAAALAFTASAASATVLNFDDLAGNTSLVPNGYGGFNWQAGSTNLGAIADSFHPGSGYDNGVVSPNNAIFNYYGNSGAKIDWASAGTFTFNGAYLTSAWSNQQISFAGFNDGVQLFSSASYSINTQSPLWINLDWSGIDSIQIFNNGGQHWALDDFTFNGGGVNVPESTSLMLLGLGLLGLGLARRRKA